MICSTLVYLIWVFISCNSYQLLSSRPSSCQARTRRESGICSHRSVRRHLPTDASPSQTTTCSQLSIVASSTTSQLVLKVGGSANCMDTETCIKHSSTTNSQATPSLGCLGRACNPPRFRVRGGRISLRQLCTCARLNLHGTGNQ